MASRVNVLIATIATFICSQASGQFYGLRAGDCPAPYLFDPRCRPRPIWGSQTHNARGFSSPITVGAGASLPLLPTLTGAPPKIDVIRNLNQFENGGYSETVGAQLGPAQATISQTHDAKGFVGPKMVIVGADVLSQNGNGVSGSVDAIPGIGGSGTLKRVVGIINNPGHEVSAYVQHDRSLDKNLKPIGPETNSAGINYSNKNNGASAFLTTSQTNGAPAVTSLGGSVPIVKSGDVQVSATGQMTAGHGRKPEHQVGVEVSASF